MTRVAPALTSRDNLVASGAMSKYPAARGFWSLVAFTVPFARLLPPNALHVWEFIIISGISVSALRGHLRLPRGGAALWLILAGTVAGTFLSAPPGQLRAGILATFPNLFILVFGALALRYYISQDTRFLMLPGVSFAVSQSISAIIGIGQLLGLTVLGQAAEQGRAVGLAQHPNALGLLSSLALLLLLVAIPKLRSGALLLAVIAITINGIALIGSGSLTSLGAFAIGAAILLLGSRLTATRALVGMILLVLASVGLVVSGVFSQFVASTVSSRFLTVTQSAGGASSLFDRQQTYRYAWNYIRQSPTVGVGMDSSNAGTFDGRTEVHNVVLHAWFQGGIFTAAGFVALIATLIALAIFAIIRRTAVGGAAVILTVLSFAMTSAFLLEVYYWLPVIFAWATIPNRPSRAPLR